MKNHKSLIINHKSFPIQYQRGYVEFYKLKFKVTSDVLIPRPESELLVDEILNYLSTNNYKLITILDIGTGSGNIAISIAKNSKHIRIIATDISKKALQIAKQNAKLHGVEDKITFIKNDLLSVIPANAGIHLSNRLLDPRLRGDDNLIWNNNFKSASSQTSLIIVTNLPYIPTQRIPYLDSSVKDFEPHIALDGGEDGFSLYRKLFQQIQKIKFNFFVGEIDYTHGELAINEAQKYFPDAEIEVKTDLAKKQRILLIRGFSNDDR